MNPSPALATLYVRKADDHFIQRTAEGVEFTIRDTPLSRRILDNPPVHIYAEDYYLIFDKVVWEEGD